MIEYNNRHWHKHIFVWNGSVIQGVWLRVTLYIIWTALITFFYQEDILPTDVKVDMVVFNVIGLALGLLLVFRTNTSYDRWWEGRKLLGSNANSGRNIAFMLNTIVPINDKDTRKDFVDLISAFNYAVKERLRDGVSPEHLPMLKDEYKKIVFNSGNVPFAIMKLIRSKIEIIRHKNMDRIPEFSSIYDGVSNMINNMGGMERIRFTPVPFAYASHLQLFVMIYFLALPFGLNDKFGWLAVPVMGFLTLILLGINEIGVEIEDPFGDDPNDLPVDQICKNISSSITEILF
ncbi:MAG: bestrophin family protein [Mariniphaga sp.]